MLKPAIIALLLLMHPASARDCPPLPEQKVEKDRLHRELLAANNEASARIVGGRLWSIWISAPDQHAQEMLDRGMARIRSYDFDGAENILNDLVEYCPNYAEGWNQRAYARFLKQDYDRSLEDLDRTLEHEPRHFGALAGRALVLMNMGRVRLGQLALKDALKVNPWLSERRLLAPEKEI